MSRNIDPATLVVDDVDDEYEDDERGLDATAPLPPLPIRMVVAPDPYDMAEAPARSNMPMIMGILGFGAVAALVMIGLIVKNLSAGEVVPPPTTGAGAVSPVGAGTPQTGAAVGMYAPDFVAQSTDGQTVRLSDFRGKQAVWLNFWASWCGPCKQEMPAMEEIHQANKTKDFVMLGFDVREEAPTVKGFIAEKFHWTFLVEPGGATSDHYYVYGIPTHVFINKQGIITNLMASGLPKQIMESEIQKMLKN